MEAHQRRLAALVTSLFCVCFAICPPSSAAPEVSSRQYAELERLRCGSRAAFLLAHSCELLVSYEELVYRIPEQSGGASIKHVAESLSEIGLPCQILKMAPSDLFKANGTFIVHHHPRYASSSGHFLVGTAVHAKGIELVDPITGKCDLWQWSHFSDAFSGYVVIPLPEQQPALPMCFLLTLVAAMALFGAVRFAAFDAKFQKCKTGTQKLMIFILIGASGVAEPNLIAASTSVRRTQSDDIRNYSRDGTNVIALITDIMLPSQGEQLLFEDSAPLTLLDVKRELKKRSLHCDVRTLTIDQLRAANKPLIVPLRRTCEPRAAFHLVLHTDNDSLTAVRAGDLTVRQWSEDEFLRDWTGHAIVISSNPVGLATPFVTAAFVVYLMGIFLLFRKPRRIEKESS